MEQNQKPRISIFNFAYAYFIASPKLLKTKRNSTYNSVSLQFVFQIPWILYYLDYNIAFILVQLSQNFCFNIDLKILCGFCQKAFYDSMKHKYSFI